MPQGASILLCRIALRRRRERFGLGDGRGDHEAGCAKAFGGDARIPRMWGGKEYSIGDGLRVPDRSTLET
jgi:hypothetical protein